MRREFETRTLVQEHPPVWMHPHKQQVYEIACPPSSQHGGHINYSRWPAMELPGLIDVASALETAVQRPGFYDYKPFAKRNAVEWHVNFADPHLFTAYSTSLLAQDELQVLEHPALGSVKEAIESEGVTPLTIENDEPTPILLTGIERRCHFDTQPGEKRPHGLYGNKFAMASIEAIRLATHRLEPPTISKIVAIAAPSGGSGPYRTSTLRYILTSAYTGFRAAVLESERLRGRPCPVVVHSGFWGCGAYGGNRTIMAALQVLAASMAGAHRLVFHTGEKTGTRLFRQGKALCKDELGIQEPVATKEAISAIASLEYEWGVSNGT